MRALSRRRSLPAAGFAALLTLLAMGPAHANPEPPTPPAATADPTLEREAADAQRADALLQGGAIGVGVDADGSLVALYPRGAGGAQARTAAASNARAATAVLDRADLDRFDKVMEARAWHPGAKDYAYGYYADAATGRMIVETPAPPNVMKALVQQFPGAIEVRQTTKAGRLSRQNDTAPHWGGAAIIGQAALKPGYLAKCSSGFVVKNSAGTKYMVTAGHCFASGASVTSVGGGWSFGSVVNRASYPLWDLELLGGGTYGNSIYTGDATGTGAHVVSAANPGINYTYCVSGQATNSTCNHKVSSLTASYCDTAGCTTGLIAASGGTSLADGDSGAPFYYQSGSSAYIRGLAIALNGSTMYAEKWSTIAGHFNVSINS